MSREFKQKDTLALQGLVGDCVNYGFSERESLAYIRGRFGKEISARTYYKFKKKVDNGEYSKQWLNYFTKVGFVIKHQQIIDVAEMIHKDTIRDYLIEQNRREEERSDLRIRQLRFDIRENSKLLQELTLGTPIVAQIKAKIDQLQQTTTTTTTTNNAQVLHSGK